MVVFFDIDGTIVDDDTQIIPESAVRAVERLRQNGHLAVVNTGRPYSHIDPRVRGMDFGGWVCGCGMEILVDGKWLLRRHPEDSVCLAVRDAVRECGMQVLYEGRDNGTIYADGQLSTHPKLAAEANRMIAKGFPVVEIDTLPVPRFMKGVTYDCDGCRREEFLARISPWFDCIDRGNTMVEMVLQGSSKAGGMLQLLELLGLPREDTLAIGDSTNDLPMFAVARHTACMGNGMQQLKEQAEFVTASVLDDGIEKALRHYGLI